MVEKIQIKRGLKIHLPVLSEGELGFCTDTKELYVGDGKTNTLVNQNKEFTSTYTHTQVSPLIQWTIVHNLNKYPNITIVDSANNVVTGDVTYIDENIITVKFSAAFGGAAFLN